MDALERLLGRIDRRLVYLGLVVFTLVPLWRQWNFPLQISSPVQSLYDTIEQVPPDKVVVLGCDWDAGTQPESRPQTMGLARHLIRRHLKFILISVGYPQSPQLSQDVVTAALREEKKLNPALDFQYGRDWVNLGYKELTRPWLLSFTNSLQAQVKADWKNKPLAATFVQGVDRWGRTGQVELFIDITGSATISEWRPLLYPKGCKVGLACTAVMAPEQYNFLANGQMIGMLTGLKGAAEYEQLMGYQRTGQASRQMPGQSFAHLYILVLLLLGNLAVLSGALRARPRGRR